LKPRSIVGDRTSANLPSTETPLKPRLPPSLCGMSGCALLLTGCPSVSTYRLARTLNRGTVQGYVAPGGGGAFVTTTTGGTSATASAGYPVLQLGIRYGITDRVEKSSLVFMGLLPTAARAYQGRAAQRIR
jgi:hypothetical protein